jgi:hypothetical protein
LTKKAPYKGRRGHISASIEPAVPRVWVRSAKNHDPGCIS